jgi:hypothetical protein
MTLTVTWHTAIYFLAGWGLFDLLVRALYRIPPWAGLDHLPPLMKRDKLRVKVLGTGVGRFASTGWITEVEDLLGSLWLYVNWPYVTGQLTTVQKNLWADAVDRWHARLNPTENVHPIADRWWND